MSKKTKYKFFNSKFTSAVSVSMVLFLLGCTLSVAMVAKNMSDSILEKIALTVYIKDNVAKEAIQSIGNYLNAQPYTKQAAFISKEQAIRDVCAEIGEDPEEFVNYNPLIKIFYIKFFKCK